MENSILESDGLLEKQRPRFHSSKIGTFNTVWTDNQKALVDKTQNHYQSFGPFIRYAVTLQTRFIPKRDKFRVEQQIITLQNDFWHFKNRINYHFYGKTGHRKPNVHSLLILPTIEGTAFSPEGERTIHYHVGFGNVPREVSAHEFHYVIRKHWLKSKLGIDMIKVKSADPDWMEYITKEVEKGNTQCVDWRSACIPHEALHI